MPNRPTYTLHPSYPIRRVLWRPGYECELAVVSHVDFSVSSQHIDHLYPSSPSTRGRGPSSGLQSRVGSSIRLDTTVRSLNDLNLTPKEPKSSSMSLQQHSANPISDAVEIWDVRRSWLPKWSVSGTSVEGGVTGTQYSIMVRCRILNYYHVDIEFADPYTLLAQNTSGTFTQLDMRDVTKPLDTISRASITWTPNSTLAFVIDNAPRSEIPYDDMYVQSLTITYAAHSLFCFLFTYLISSHPTKLNHEIMTLVEPSVIKHIGDRSFQPKTQKLGWFRSPEIQSSVDSFATLAASYVIDGDDASSSCVKNMEVRFVQAFLFPISDHTNQAALAAGKPHIAQIWMLMLTLLSEVTNLPQPTTRSPSATPPDSPSKRAPHVASLGNITTAAVRQQNQIQQRKQTHCPGAQTQHGPSTPPSVAIPTPIPAQSSIPHTLPSWRNTSTPASTGASANTSRSPDFSRVPRPGSSYHFPSLLHSASSRLRTPTTTGVAVHRSPSVSKRPTPASSNASSPLHLATTLPPVVSNTIVNANVPTPRRTSGLTLSLRRESIDSGAADSSVMTSPGTTVTARKPVSSSTQRSFSISASRRQYQQQQEFHGRMSPGDQNLLVAASTKHVGEGVLSDSDSDEEKEGQEETEPDGDDREEGGNEEMDHNNGELLPSTNNDEMIVSSAADFAVPGSLFSQASQKERNRRGRLWTAATKTVDGDAYHDHLSKSPSSGSTDSEEDGEEDEEEDETTQKSFATISLANQRTSFEKGVDLRQRSRSSTLASLPAGPVTAQVQVSGQGRVPTLSLKHGNQSSTKNIVTVEADSNGGSRIIDQSPVPDTRVGRDSQPRALTTSTSRHRTGTKQQKPHGHDIYSRSHTEEAVKAKAERMTKRRIEIVKAQEERIENYVWEAVKKAFEELLVIVSFPRCVYWYV